MQEQSDLSNISPMLKSYTEKITLTCPCGKTFEAYKVFQSIRPKINGQGLCYECREKKRREYEEQEKQTMAREILEKKERWHRTCGIPARFQSKHFGNFQVSADNTLAYEMSRDYAESFPLIGSQYHSLGLISDGIWGVGKTHLVCAIGHRVIDRCGDTEKCPVYYLTEPQMYSRLRATYNRREGEETEYELFDTLVNIPLLIVDDVGKEEVSDPRFVQRVWFQVINGRYDNMLPIVVTANMSPDGLAHHLGGSRNNEASFDRLYEMLNGVFFEIGGQSYRRRE